MCAGAVAGGAVQAAGFASAPAGRLAGGPGNRSTCQEAFPEVTASGQLSVELDVFICPPPRWNSPLTTGTLAGLLFW